MSQKSGGLAGIVVGNTAISTVGKTGLGLTYRGYDIHDLAQHAEFEEVAHLLIYGKLPNQHELDTYKKKLSTLREVPEALRLTLEKIPAYSHPMDVLRTGCSMLGNLEPESPSHSQEDIANRLLACTPGILLYWYQFHYHQKKIVTLSDEPSLAGHFLHLLHSKKLMIFRQKP